MPPSEPSRTLDSARQPGGAFPTTQRSLVAALRADDPRRREVAWDELLRAYWKPVHRYLRRRWSIDSAQAEDWTQEFLLRAIERGTFDGYDPVKARFRTFLRVCLDRWVANQRAAAARLKRGGGQAARSLDAVAPHQEPADTVDPEELFHREWVRSLFEAALDELRRRCAVPERRVRLLVFERLDLGDGEAARPTYAELADELALPVTQITNHLAWARRELRRLLLDELRRHTASEREFRDEARRALGAEPR